MSRAYRLPQARQRHALKLVSESACACTRQGTLSRRPLSLPRALSTHSLHTHTHTAHTQSMLNSIANSVCWRGEKNVHSSLFNLSKTQFQENFIFQHLRSCTSLLTVTFPSSQRYLASFSLHLHHGPHLPRSSFSQSGASFVQKTTI